jgi:hypothetical protein
MVLPRIIKWIEMILHVSSESRHWYGQHSKYNQIPESPQMAPDDFQPPQCSQTLRYVPYKPLHIKPHELRWSDPYNGVRRQLI